jgi:hypothetical protein
MNVERTRRRAEAGGLGIRIMITVDKKIVGASWVADTPTRGTGVLFWARASCFQNV